MTLRLVIDVNLSPDWVPVLADAGFEVVHWSQIGDRRAPDREIMDWAIANDHIILSHDLDFSTMLALTHAGKPSLVQLRGSKVLPEQVADLVIQSLQRFQMDLETGALLLIEPSRCRIRILPL